MNKYKSLGKKKGGMIHSTKQGENDLQELEKENTNYDFFFTFFKVLVTN